MDDRDELCPGNCGERPRRGCGCQDDGEQYRLPRAQWTDANPARRTARSRSR